MRKKIALLLAIITASVSLAACTGGSQPVGGTSTPTAQSQTSQTDSTAGSASEGEAVSETTEESGMTGEVSVPASDDTKSEAESSKPDGSSAAQTSKTGGNSSKSESSAQQSSSKPAQQSSTAQQSSSKPAQQSSTAQQSSSKPVQTSTVQQSSSKPAQTSTVQQSSSKPASSSTAQSSATATTDSNYDIGGMALYNELFNLENKVTVDISMTQDQMNLLQQDYNKYYGRDENTKSSVYRMATVTFTVGSKKYTVEEVGIRLKGNQSLEPLFDGNKPNICSFKLSFDEAFDDKTDYGSNAKKWSSDSERSARKKRKFASMNELDIKWNICYDNTNIREIYATKLFESEGLLVQKIGLSQLKFNGNNYGLVKIYETVDKTFLEKRLPEKAIGGDLYKCMWSECNNSGARTGGWRGATLKLDNSYGVQDNEKGKKFNLNLKTNKSSSNHSTLKNFLSVINKSNPTKAELENVVDIEYWAKFMAATYFAGGPDDIRNNYNNYYVYFRKDTGKALFIVYDNDRTLGITIGLNKNTATRNPYSSYAATQNDQQNPLIKKTVSHDASATFKYVRDTLYKNALDRIAASKWMKDSTEFNKMYNTAKSNYESIITPYTKFANQKYTFKFSLDGNKNGADNENMSFENFRSQIVATAKSATP